MTELLVAFFTKTLGLWSYGSFMSSVHTKSFIGQNKNIYFAYVGGLFLPSHDIAKFNQRLRVSTRIKDWMQI